VGGAGLSDEVLGADVEATSHVGEYLDQLASMRLALAMEMARLGALELQAVKTGRLGPKLSGAWAVQTCRSSLRVWSGGEVLGGHGQGGGPDGPGAVL
jgi:hypothetical protein